jgi:hypothetical protein
VDCSEGRGIVSVIKHALVSHHLALSYWAP